MKIRNKYKNEEDNVKMNKVQRFGGDKRDFSRGVRLQ